mmetsp:Transcript_16512/g.39302  ORF Transcript_16512/g.39302 Transcript_16512/m.39302 type:complete len:264 (+) Transcript_16512:314-1105(+)
MPDLGAGTEGTGLVGATKAVVVLLGAPSIGGSALITERPGYARRGIPSPSQIFTVAEASRLSVVLTMVLGASNLTIGGRDCAAVGVVRGVEHAAVVVVPEPVGPGLSGGGQAGVPSESIDAKLSAPVVVTGTSLLRAVGERAFLLGIDVLQGGLVKLQGLQILELGLLRLQRRREGVRLLHSDATILLHLKQDVAGLPGLALKHRLVVATTGLPPRATLPAVAAAAPPGGTALLATLLAALPLILGVVLGVVLGVILPKGVVV